MWASPTTRTEGQAAPNFIHTPCEMWKEFLWNFGGPKFSSHPLWMDLFFSTPGCGEKTALLLNSFQVIHIIFYYDSCYYK